MKAILSDILDYSIENYTLSVGNSDKESTYIIPYDGAAFDEILKIVPNIEIEAEPDSNDVIDDLYFTLSCKYSHIGADSHLNAKYELLLENTVLATEYAPVVSGMRAKPNSLLRTARKCANKIIAQERLALKNNLVKVIKDNSGYEN